MSDTVTPASDADAPAAAPLLAGTRLEQVFALPVVEVSTLAPCLARAISEAYHLAMAMIDEARLAASEVRIALAKVVAFVAQARLHDDRKLPNRRDIKEIAAEAVAILSGLRPLPNATPAV